jgi:hypothetical protein
VTAVDLPRQGVARVQLIIDEPGLYDGLTDEVYHGDPVPEGSLSSSGARRLLPPSCPALFKHERDHGSKAKRTFDVGHAAHKLVLGVGPDLVVVDAPDWRTKAAQQQRDEAYASGAVPVLAREFAEVRAMAEALKRHDLARALLDPTRGSGEQSAFWVDDETDVWRRARFDWLPDATGHLIVPDYKTAACSSPAAFRRAAASFGYHQQASWYLDAVRALGLAETASFIFIVQEKSAPYLVSIIELDSQAMKLGAEENRRAIDIFARCMRSDTWPGYHEGVALIGLPPWAASDLS